MKFYLTTVGEVALPIVSPAGREIPDTYGTLWKRIIIQITHTNQEEPYFQARLRLSEG